MHGRFLIIGLAAMAAFAAQPALGDTVTLDATAAAAVNTLATSSDHQTGSGAWQANGTSKAELYLTPELLFGGPVAVNQIAGIKYHTKKAGDQGTPDWYISVYTVPFTGGDSSWYGHRLTFEPIYANGLNAPAGQWNQWTTDAPTNQLTVFDSNRTVIGFYNGPTLADLTAGELNWGAYPTSGCTETVDYSGETIKYIVVSTGNPWANGFTGLVDALEITLTDSTTVLVDLENKPAVWVDDDFDSSTPGWGITHFANIQLAINAVDAGGTVNVAEGNYSAAHLGSWTYRDLLVSKSLSLVGAGSGKTIVQWGNKQHGMEIVGSANPADVSVEGMAFNGGQWAIIVGETGGVFSNLTFRDVEIASGSARNLHLANATYQNVTIQDCNIHHAGAWGLSARGTIGAITVINSKFDYNGQVNPAYGIGFDLDMPTAVGSVSVTGGSFSHNTLKGINLVKTDNATFSNITADGNGGNGVCLWEWKSASSNLTFENCRLSGNGLDGMLFGTQGTCTISGVTIDCCTLSNNQRDGILFYHDYGGVASNVAILNCSIFSNSGKGVAVSGMTETVAAENNWWGTADGAQIAAMVAGSVDYDPYLTTPPDCQTNVLYLTPETESLYVKFGEQVVIDMNVANLSTMVNGCQALLGYSSLYFPTAGTVAPGGGGVWTELIYQSWAVAGELDTAIGVQMEGPAGTNADGTVAVITLTAGTTEGRTRMVFRPDGEGGYATMFSDLTANPVWPTKLDSVNVTIDNTAPVITVPDDATETEAQYSMVASATDALAGIASFTMNGAAFTSPTLITLVPGANTFTFVAIDRAGNSTTEIVTITYNQPAPVIDVFHAIAPNVYAGSSSYNAWLANSIVGARDKTSPVGDAGYAQYKDLGAAVQDYAAAMVTSFRSWMGLITSDNEWGSRTTYVYRIDNGVQTNPGAAKLNLDHVAVTWKWNLLGADAPEDNYTYDFSYNWTTAPRATLTFAAGPQRLKGYNWDGSQWVEVTSGREADLIIYNNGEGYEPEKLPGNVLKPATQDTLNELYKQLTGAVPCIDSPRQTVSDSNFVVSYAGHAGVADVTSADVGFKYNTVDATAPVVTIAIPTDGAKLNSAALTITGTATDNEILASGIRSVEIKLNGTQVYLNTTQDNVSFAQAVTLAEGSNSIEVIATDFAGNTTTASRTVLLDTVVPTIGNLTAVQVVDVLNCANPTLQGVVNISVDAADASAGLVVPPAVTVTMGSETLVVSYVDQSPAGTFNYTVEVVAATANGTWTIAATATDEAGNTASTSGTLCINKNQVTGTVSFATLSSAAYSVTRNVVLAATDSGGAVLKTWTVPVAFTNNAQTASGAYTLTDVPATMANLSADTAWSLRKRQAVTPDGNGQTAASFTLLGGDINSDNFVNILDYSVLKNNWNTSNAVADINGDGMVGTADYSILKANWFARGDAQ